MLGGPGATIVCICGEALAYGGLKDLVLFHVVHIHAAALRYNVNGVISVTPVPSTCDYSLHSDYLLLVVASVQV
jgi:hypothetical protein